MTIVEFLEARLDEDEEIARDAAGWDSSGSVRDEGLWRRDGVNSVIDSSRRMVVFGDGSAPGDSKATHIAHYDPARALSEVVAIRSLVELYGALSAHWVLNADYGFASTTLRTLAAIYSDHPDYRQEWAL